MNAHFAAWRQMSAETLKALKAGCHPKDVIAALSECLRKHGHLLQLRLDQYRVRLQPRPAPMLRAAA
jgi:type I restriction enzyme M protein